jgi:hypothetical protein
VRSIEMMAGDMESFGSLVVLCPAVGLLRPLSWSSCSVLNCRLPPERLNEEKRSLYQLSRKKKS